MSVLVFKNEYSILKTAFLFLSSSSSSRFRLSSTSSSSLFTPFSLDDELTLKIKKSIEVKWGARVYKKEGLIKDVNKKINLYDSISPALILSMFPYPSGRLHLGHVRIYTLSDSLSRFHSLFQTQVLHPMGWDSFGLPAENAARTHNISASEWTANNIRVMREQMELMGCAFDWDSEISTCEKEYYKWTQWLFCKLWEKGLVYKKRSWVLWDPVDETVLAEEQVDGNNRSWRSGAVVEKKLLNQWFVRTTVFAQDLTQSLNSSQLKKGWRDIVEMQKHWIGPISGYASDCPLIPMSHNAPVSDFAQSNNAKDPGNEHFVRIWFTSPKSFQNSHFIILNPSHYLLSSPQNIHTTFPNGIKQLSFYCLNPLTGAHMPIYVQGEKCTLPTVPESADGRLNEILKNESIYGDLTRNEEFMTEAIANFLSFHKFSESKLSGKEFKYYPSSLKLRDWLVSRQRDWGTPIPAYFCHDCHNTSVLHENELPVLTKSEKVGEDNNVKSSHNIKCRLCGSSNIEMERDTLDTFFDSSWYYLRYLDPHNKDEIFNKEKIAKWLPVKVYIGGKEHATLHLYYARFVSHFLHQLGYIPIPEPLSTFVQVGMVMSQTYATSSGKYLPYSQIRSQDGKFFSNETNEEVERRWEKMSKSKENGVEPERVVEEYGVDTMRLLSLADVAPASVRKWPPETSSAYLKFQNRLWLTVREFVSLKENKDEDYKGPIYSDDKIEMDLFDARNYHLKGITHNYENTHQISVVISKQQGLLTSLRKIDKKLQLHSYEFERALGTLLISIYPIMPAFSAQLWQYFRDVADLTLSDFDLDNEVWCQKWPEVDGHYKCELLVELNSNEIDVIKVERNTLDSLDEKLALEFALDSEVLQNYHKGQSELEKEFNVSSFVLHKGFRATISLSNPNHYHKVKTESKKKHKKRQVEN